MVRSRRRMIGIVLREVFGKPPGSHFITAYSAKRAIKTGMLNHNNPLMRKNMNPQNPRRLIQAAAFIT